MTITGNIGRVARAPINFSSANINQHIARIRIQEGSEVSADYVYQCLKHAGYVTHYRAILTGQAYPQISLQQVRETPIPLPTFPEQQKIAAILTAVDDKLNVIARQIKTTQSLKQGLIQTLFSQGVGTQDVDGRWMPHTEFKGSELGEIPVEWQVVQIQTVSEVIRGASPRPQGDPRYYGGDVPRLMGADVTRDGKWVTPKIDFLTEEGAKRSRPCPKGTLTIICSGDVGVPSFLAVDACIHDGFLALIKIDESQAKKEYLYHIICSVKQRFYASATHGGVFTNLTTGILKEFLVPLPKLVEQQRITSILDVADEKISAAFRKQEYYKSLKRGLMQKLLTGEWRVKLGSSTGKA
ncbi:restriction endonuclease subunit S [Stutzerimonas stutzeri]|uniref:restriction endonuclease subunit S n=1 Tax=Stutzerimonas stutzeri TaxID=316 RepID=UPI00210D9091|nr:restriction endonuclease subunit S [Stutzerimonas stutzeri]MCQ4322323.1 restriction endonuclease subunit S [Stutzerimonas stutzeri]